MQNAVVYPRRALLPRISQIYFDRFCAFWLSAGQAVQEIVYAIFGTPSFRNSYWAWNWAGQRSLRREAFAGGLLLRESASMGTAAKKKTPTRKKKPERKLTRGTMIDLYEARQYLGLDTLKETGLRMPVRVYFKDPAVAASNEAAGFDTEFTTP